MPKKKSKTPVTIEASAKAHMVAKATLEHKKIIQETIPEDVTRANNNAWLDLISPLTEWAGLKGDELRFKRTQLRLQREDVLSEIIFQARRKISQSSHFVRPLSNKFIVPFLEKASLEDIDSSLIEMWANLLASATTQDNSHNILFVNIISQISTKQAKVLQNLIKCTNSRDLEHAVDDIRAYYQIHHIKRSIEIELAGQEDDFDDEEMAGLISEYFNHPCIEVVHLEAGNTKNKDYFDILTEYSQYKDDDEVDFSILAAIGLIKIVEFDAIIENWEISGTYYHLSELGFYFSLACGLVAPVPD